MVVRFLVAVAFLLGVVVTPGLWRVRQQASASVTVVAVPPPAPEPPKTHDDVASLEAAVAMIRSGRPDDVLRADPQFATRVLRAIAARRLDKCHALAGAALVGLGDASRRAAFALSHEGNETEREVARLALLLLNGDSVDDLASWRPLPRVEW